MDEHHTPQIESLPSRLPWDDVKALARDPGALPIIEERYVEAKVRVYQCEEQMEKTRALAFALPDDELWVIGLMDQLDKRKMLKARREERKWRRLLLIAGGEELEDPYAKVEEAKRVPLETFYAFQKLTRIQNRSKALCPFHQEKTPSFTIYHDTNTYHCFGCSAHGDIVTFVRELHDCSFQDALEIIT